jgi:hypothetical protein
MLKLVQNRERPGAQPTQEDLVLASGKSASVGLEDLGTSWELLIFSDDLHVWVRDLSQLRPRYEQSDPRQSRSEPLAKSFLATGHHSRRLACSFEKSGILPHFPAVELIWVEDADRSSEFRAMNSSFGPHMPIRPEAVRQALAPPT